MPMDPLDCSVFALRVLQDAPVVILVLDLQGRIEYVNPFFERLTGYRLDEVRGKDWIDAFLPPRDHALIRTLLDRSCGGEHVRGHVNPIVTRTGEERQIKWTDEHLHDDEGRATCILAIGQDVTERQAAREALRTSEQRLAEAQRIAHLGSWELDLQSGANWWSEQQYQIHGLAPGTALSQERFLATIHPDDRARFEREFRTAIASGECDHEYRIVRPDGEVRILHGRARVTLDERGLPVKLAGTNQDITERKQVEEAQRRARDMLDATLKALPDLMFEVDEDGRLFDYHAPHPSMLAVPPERFLGRTFHDVLPTDAADACLAAVREAAREGHALGRAYRLEMSDGARWYEPSVARKTSPGASRFILLARDVSDRVRADQARRAKENELRVIADNLPIAFTYVDRHQRYRFVNRVHAQAVGPSPDSTIGRTVREIIGEESYARHRDRIAGVLAGHRQSYVESHSAPGAPPIEYSVNLLPDLDDHGVVVGYFSLVFDITTKVAAERQIAEQSRMLELLFHHSIDNIVILDRDYNFVRVSDSYARACQMEVADLIGKNHFAVFPSPFSEEIAPYRQSKQIYRRSERPFEFPAHPEWGTTYWDLAMVPILDAAGEIEWYLLTLKDVTEHRRAQDALLQRDNLLRAAMDAAPMALFALDPEGRFTLMEGSILNVLGLRPGELLGRSAFELYADRPDYTDRLRRALAGELVTVQLQSRSRWFDVTHVPLPDASGRSGVVSLVLDVTNVVEAQQSLQESTERLQLALEASGQSTWDLDLETMTAEYSPGYAEMLGFATDGLRDRTATDSVANIHPSDLERVVAAFKACLAGETAKFQAELRARTKSGAWKWILANGKVVERAADGRPLRLLGTHTDIDDRKTAELLVASSLREKETLLREIHHRVKNNLQMVSSLLYFQNKRVPTPEGRAAFAELRRRIFAMTLVHERLYQSRDVARVDFGDYLKALITDLARSFPPNDGIRIEVTSDDVRLPIELALPSGMLMCELVTNVLKYAYPGARTGTASVSVRAQDGRIVLSVDDDGVGFPDGFDLRAATSFGWELVRTLVVQLDGTVSATTDHGAHVRVSFAVAAADEAAHQSSHNDIRIPS
ncbi:MAG: PAS domain S-box protein [Nannocystis sp.]|nr:PAS domain S-box protein [Nannocystis sp.]